MNEITVTMTIFLSLSSSAWLIWHFLFHEKITEELPKKQNLIPVNPTELYINHIEQRYEESSTKADAFAQENRELKGKLFHEKNRVLTLTDRLHDLQGRDFVFRDYLRQKPNMGTNKYLLSQYDIKTAYKEVYSDWHKYTSLLNLLNYELKNAIFIIQKVRNRAAHEGAISKKECDEVRGVLIGVGQSGVMSEILKN